MRFASTSSQRDTARARTSENQWKALASRFQSRVAATELLALERFASFANSRQPNLQTVKKHLVNSLATEALLRHNASSLEGDALKNSVVWAFPQAYYCVFASTHAFFEVAGYPQRQTHHALIRKFGDEVRSGTYPRAIGVAVVGTPATGFIEVNLAPTALRSTLYFDDQDQGCVDAHIRSLLQATRKDSLRQWLVDKSQKKTSKGTPKKRFTAADYEHASSKHGVTSILSFLYRKRIRSNYHDVDSLLADPLDAESILQSVIKVVECINTVHEAYIAQAIGAARYRELLTSTNDRVNGPALARLAALETLR